MQLTRIINAFCYIMLLLAFLAAVLVGVWQLSPGIVDRIDNKLVRLYDDHYESKLQQIEKKIKPGKAEQAYIELSVMLNDLKSVKKADRLGPIKSQVYSKLISVGIEQQLSTRDVEGWYLQWEDFDENNIAISVARASYLSDQREYERALLILSDLFRKLPESDLVAKAYVETALAAGKNNIALTILNKFVEKRLVLPDDRWRIWWGEPGASYLNMLAWASYQLSGKYPEYDFSTNVAIEGKFASIEIRVPDSFFGWCLGGLVISFKDELFAEDFFLSQYPPFDFSDSLKKHNDSYKITPGLNSFQWAIPEKIQAKDMGGFIISGKLTDCSLQWVDKYYLILKTSRGQQLELAEGER